MAIAPGRFRHRPEIGQASAGRAKPRAFNHFLAAAARIADPAAADRGWTGRAPGRPGAACKARRAGSKKAPKGAFSPRPPKRAVRSAERERLLVHEGGGLVVVGYSALLDRGGGNEPRVEQAIFLGLAQHDRRRPNRVAFVFDARL